MLHVARTLLLAAAIACDSESVASDAGDGRDRDADWDAGDAHDAHDAHDGGDGHDGGDTGAPDAAPPRGPLRIQVFSRTAGFRHDSIEPASAAIRAIADQHGATLQLTEDPAVLTAGLSQTDVVVFLMTTGDVLEPGQEAEFERFIRGGGGFVGVHSAADTEYDWPFYGELNGAWFKDHPAVQNAAVLVEAVDDPLVSFLPRRWERSDEWYNFRANPRGRVTVLLRLDESTYSGGNMGGDHPIAWSRSIDAGRAFYTGFGHTRESWEEPMVLEHIERALLWAGRPPQ